MPTFADYMPVDQVEEASIATDMQGDASIANHRAAKDPFWADPTKALVGLWMLALAFYWLLGYFFRNQRY
jgi:hypothetical protein